ncbi:MAG: hypothetical protein ACXWE7_03940 [Nitrososphaeraceae archaeon]
MDTTAGTITLPLYQGKVKLEGGIEQNVWYILTDTTDKGNVDALGLNYSPKLIYSAVGARSAMLGQNNTLIFNGGTVDFNPEHQLLAGNTTSNPFPPKVTNAGSVGDKDLSFNRRVPNTWVSSPRLDNWCWWRSIRLSRNYCRLSYSIPFPIETTFFSFF